MVSRELLAACRRGDPRAFEEVVRTTHRQVYTQAFRLVGDRQEAEDVAQEAYLRVFRGLSSFRGDSLFETWLYRIVANAAMSHLRRKGRFGVLLAEPAEEGAELPSDLRLAEEAVDRDTLARALEALPDGSRTVVLLKDVYGLSCQEIGDELGISEGAVKVRLHRARKRLKEMLYGPEERGDGDADV
jgi:RNA polymerase sigma-70 factor, ECF subfamily